MIITTRWQMTLRFIASVLLFESALSFRQPPLLQHLVPPDDLHRCSFSRLPPPSSSASSSSLSSPCTRGPGVCQRTGGSSISLRPGGLRRMVAGCGRRQRQRERPSAEQPSVVVMLAAGGGGEGCREAGPGRAVGVPAAAAGGAPSSKSEHQQIVSSSVAAAAAAAAADPAQASRRRRHGHQFDSDFLFEQKLESIRAALLCGAVGAASRLLGVGAGALIPVGLLRDVLAAPEPAASSLLFCLAAGFVQGALFGLTYRYVVRSDRETPNAAGGDTATRTSTDPPALQMDVFTVGHLGDGCVAAFALTSALAQSEVPLTLAAGEFVGVLGREGGIVEAFAAVLLPAAPFLPRAAGDLFLYSATRTAIDRALDLGAIKPFP